MRAVFATDLSTANEQAIRSQATLDSLADIGVTEVHLITVVPDTVSTGLPGMSVATDAKKALRSQQQIFEAAGFSVEGHVARGTPHRRINGFAERLHADLVIVGSRGQSPLRNRLIGSTARNVARTAVRPLLVERIADPDSDTTVVKEHLFENVLFATDFSSNAHRAYEFLPRLEGAAKRVTLLHVRGHEQRDLEQSPEEAREKLAELAQPLASTYGMETTVKIREGDVTEEILAEERESDATVTLIGARGRSRLRRLLLGSTSESIVAQGNNNVLLVPPGPAR